MTLQARSRVPSVFCSAPAGESGRDGSCLDSDDPGLSGHPSAGWWPGLALFGIADMR